MKITFLSGLSIGQGLFISELANDPKPALISTILTLLIEVFRFFNRKRKNKELKQKEEKQQ